MNDILKIGKYEFNSRLIAAVDRDVAGESCNRRKQRKTNEIE